MPDVSQAVILIPSLHPDDKLGKYVSALVKSGFEHIVVVNDGSGPDYAPFFEALKALPQCDVLGYEVNRGKGYALKHGMNHIMAAYPDAPGIITADSDGQHTVDDCLKVGAAMLDNPEQLALGTRDFSQSDVPAKSRMGNRLTTFFFALLYGHWLPDTQTGLRGISRELMPRITKVPGARFEYEMTMLVYCAGWHIGFNKVTISTIYLEENQSSHFRPFQDSVRIYAQLFRNFFKFASNSLISTLLDLGLFTLLDKWLLGALFPVLAGGRSYYQVLAATAIARACSAMFNYKVNNQFVFRASKSRGSLFRYTVLVMAVMLASATLVNALSLWLGMGRTLVKIIVDTMLFFINYRVQKSWVFKRPAERNQ